VLVDAGALTLGKVSTSPERSMACVSASVSLPERPFKNAAMSQALACWSGHVARNEDLDERLQAGRAVLVTITCGAGIRGD
jgi:hypothetical protein